MRVMVWVIPGVIQNYYLNFFEHFFSKIVFKQNYFPLYFQNVIWPFFYFIFLYFFLKSEKAKHSTTCLSFSGNMPEAQIWKVPNNPC